MQTFTKSEIVELAASALPASEASLRRWFEQMVDRQILETAPGSAKGRGAAKTFTLLEAQIALVALTVRTNHRSDFETIHELTVRLRSETAIKIFDRARWFVNFPKNSQLTDIEDQPWLVMQWMPISDEFTTFAGPIDISVEPFPRGFLELLIIDLGRLFKGIARAEV